MECRVCTVQMPAGRRLTQSYRYVIAEKRTFSTLAFCYNLHWCMQNGWLDWRVWAATEAAAATAVAAETMVMASIFQFSELKSKWNEFWRFLGRCLFGFFGNSWRSQFVKVPKTMNEIAFNDDGVDKYRYSRTHTQNPNKLTNNPFTGSIEIEFSRGLLLTVWYTR